MEHQAGPDLRGPAVVRGDENMPVIIESSHQRSLSYGLCPGARPDFSPLARNDLSMLIAQNRLLHAHAVPVMETLYQQIVNTHNMVILTDAKGVIVHSLGDDDFLEKASRVALQPGVAWSEESKGTNAIGTAIAENTATVVHADQHYLQANHFLTCSAAPIADHQGNVIGVLDVSGDQRSFHKHTMALVRMSALMIENQLFSASFEDSITLHFHARQEFIGTLMEGIASFTPGGRFLSANRNGLFQLGLSFSALQSHTFSSLFGMPVSAMFDHYRTAAPGLLNLCMHSGVRVYGRAQLQLRNEVQALSGNNERGSLAVSQATAASQAAQAANARRLSGLRYLNTGDPQLEQVIAKVNKVLGRDIPILVMGETGTGKELLAQAIHNDSPRAMGPFVAVNCASIPETLIESELFGYEDGAFTGARKKGSIGKILAANGGTLFLDEIGDMPFGLQARLLRVLQERVVTPLGSAKSIPVNVELICATNHNLRDRIAKGLFREDLYYRLNGLVVKLPPLRERTDLEIVVKKILATESNGGRYSVSGEVLFMFMRHKWPGNFRQLTNLLRTAIIMAGDECEISLRHMPDDFLDDIDMHPAVDPGGNADKMIAAGAKLDEMEHSCIVKSLEAHGGNVSATARALGVSRNTIYRKVPHLK
ncbi:sigma-54-dependent Fis family transcriptional regulator [Massilia sp. TWR1-2-2]|uniref:sigma-54-dependent Fis family transcriptional regulator n=1 Tax=Massilia sp. TWR1-2-2 TaxID=2804584 RepID=UPI003CF61A55